MCIDGNDWLRVSMQGMYKIAALQQENNVMLHCVYACSFPSLHKTKSGHTGFFLPMLHPSEECNL